MIFSCQAVTDHITFRTLIIAKLNKYFASFANVMNQL